MGAPDIVDRGQSADFLPFVERDVQSFFSDLQLYAHFVPLLSFPPTHLHATLMATC